MIDPSVLTRRAAVRSPKGRLLLGAYLTLAIAAGLALGVLNPPGSGGRGVWAENQSTADAIFVVLDSDGTILDEYSLPAGASGVPKPQSDVASGHVTEWLVLTTSCTEARTPRPRGGVGPGAIRLLIDPTGAVWQEIADEPQGLGNLASSTACPGPFGVGPPWRPA